MHVIFLDIDGVLNHWGTRVGIGPITAEPLPIPIAPECMTRLNRLIAETGAKIVISSSWRLFARWQDLGPALLRHGLVGEVIGETPDLVNAAVWLERWQARTGSPFTYERLERGWEIREWLASHPEVTAFVILDDCSDMAELRPWLVLTQPNEGINDADVERAKWLLERSTDGLAAARDGALGIEGCPDDCNSVAASGVRRCSSCGRYEGGHEADCRHVRRLAREKLQSECDHRSETKTRTTGDPPGPWCCGRCGLELSVDPSSTSLIVVATNEAHGLEIIPPHALPNQLRTCYRGTLTQEEAQAKLGGSYRVLEVCPAQCLSADPTSDQLVAATEVIFARVS